jgi:hypothetical protein
MQSESARAASAAEARFRINAPNSRPRAIKVIALDRESVGMVERLTPSEWTHATFLTTLTSTPPPGQPFSMSGWLRDLAGHTKNLIDEINEADLVVMIATAGENAEAASIIGEACSLKRVTTTALVVTLPAVSDAALTQSLAQLRPWALMLVVASTEDYIADMLVALRA